MSKRVTLTEAEMEYLLDKVDSDLKYHRNILEKRALESLAGKLKAEPSNQKSNEERIET